MPIDSALSASPGGPGLSRRLFLAGAAGAGVAGVTACSLPHIAGSRSSSSSGPRISAGAGGHILVMVTLYGGNDGLNTVIPYQESAYLGGRPTLGYQPAEVLPLAEGLALHPNLKGLKSLWDAKQLAIVRGVGYPNPVLSHFRSMDIWQTGSPDEPVATGVLGRWLDATGHDPMRAISLGSTLPRLLSGERCSGTAITGGAISIPGGATLAPAWAAIDAPGPDRHGLAAAVAQSGADLLQVRHTLDDLLGPAPPAAATGSAARHRTATSLASQLEVVGRLIAAGSPTRVYQVSMGGFDNHAEEKDVHARLLGELDRAISGFLGTVHAKPAAPSVVLMTYSEFGRRVAQNESGGTDHGTAAPLFVVGRAVKGGRFYGDEPPLAGLDDGNLRFTTDYRRVLATMLADVVGVDPKVALTGSFQTLGLV